MDHLAESRLNPAPSIRILYVWSEGEFARAARRSALSRLHDPKLYVRRLASAVIVAFLLCGSVIIAADRWKMVGIASALLGWIALKALLVFRAGFRWRRAMRTFRSYPWCGDTLDLRLDELGLHLESKLIRATYAWGGITRAISTDEGVLAYRGPLFTWLPFDALKSGSAQDVRDLVRRHVADFRLT